MHPTPPESADRSLLMVEDNPSMAEAVAAGLRRRGYEVEHCQTLAEARLRLAARMPRYALVDLRLPDGSGLGLVKEMRQASPEISIVVLTGFASIPTAIEAIKLGATNYLCKPADVDSMDAALQGRNMVIEMPEMDLPPTVPDVQNEHIQRVLADNCSNISATARALGMHRRTLQRKLLKSPELH